MAITPTKMAGRKVRVQLGTTDVAGAMTDALTINREPIDSTDKDDAGVRQYLAELGTFSMSMSCSGHLDGTALMTVATSPTTALNAYTFDIPTYGTFSGNFCLTSFEVTGDEGADTTRFSASFESGGTVTFTAAV